ncbi:MAG: SPOR domain-containing protein [Bacteroidota bacterium]
MGIQVGKYISELLFEHDCVIIPGLGGFIANYQEATVDHGQGDIIPPSKSISFNADLQINDGLLINHITRKNHITYAEARNAVEEYTKKCKLTLENGEILALPSVGKLYKDIEDKLRFIPDSTNFLMDSFGLPKVQFYPILRAETTEEKIAIIENSVEKPIPIRERSRKRGVAWFPIAATAGVILLFLLMVPLVKYLGGFSLNSEQAGIERPLKERESDKGLAGMVDNETINDENAGLDAISEEVDPSGDPHNNNETENVASLNENVEDTPVSEEDTPVAEENIETPPVSEEESVAPPPAVTPSSTDKTYIIVVGCYGVKDNADRMAEKIKNDGYTADVGKWGKLNRVGVKVTGSRSLLNEIHQEIKDQYASGAWVLKR